VAPLDQVEIDSPAGTRIALLMQEGGNVAAYGKIASSQPTSLDGVRVNVPSKSWLVVDIDSVITPSAAVILHVLPQPTSTSSQKTKAGAYTLAQLHAASPGPTFQIVTSIKLLAFDHQNQVSAFMLELYHQTYTLYQNSSSSMQTAAQAQLPSSNLANIASQEISSDSEDESSDESEADNNVVEMQMFEAHTRSTAKQKGIYCCHTVKHFLYFKGKNASWMILRLGPLQQYLTSLPFFEK